jgi:hypothetical protein
MPWRVYTGLVVAAFTQWRLVRACAADQRLPRQRRYTPGQLTAWRVHCVHSSILPTLGTPAKPPKPCGRSPRCSKGRPSGQVKRYPALKNAA